MRSLAGTLAAPFPYFGGKSLACETVWNALGDPVNYVEPFAGSAAMLLGRPKVGKIETINDADGFVANFWRAITHDPDAVANYADWPCNETDIFARHGWLVRNVAAMMPKLESDPDWFDAKIAGWWCWGACNWIGSGWCSGIGPWVQHNEQMVNRMAIPHLSAGQGINRQLPHLSAGQGINRQLPHLSAGQGSRRAFIHEWFRTLHDRLRDVRVACGDWGRVVRDSVTTRHGVTGMFLDPPYTRGEMDYSAGGVGTDLPLRVQEWCRDNGHNPMLRIVLCGHAGEHDALLNVGWHRRTWKARKGYAMTIDAIENSDSETLWVSPHCCDEINIQANMFGGDK